MHLRDFFLAAFLVASFPALSARCPDWWRWFRASEPTRARMLILQEARTQRLQYEAAVSAAFSRMAKTLPPAELDDLKINSVFLRSPKVLALLKAARDLEVRLNVPVHVVANNRGDDEIRLIRPNSFFLANGPEISKDRISSVTKVLGADDFSLEGYDQSRWDLQRKHILDPTSPEHTLGLAFSDRVFDQRGEALSDNGKRTDLASKVAKDGIYTVLVGQKEFEAWIRDKEQMRKNFWLAVKREGMRFWKSEPEASSRVLGKSHLTPEELDWVLTFAEKRGKYQEQLSWVTSADEWASLPILRRRLSWLRGSLDNFDLEGLQKAVRNEYDIITQLMRAPESPVYIVRYEDETSSSLRYGVIGGLDGISYWTMGFAREHEEILPHRITGVAQISKETLDRMNGVAHVGSRLSHYGHVSHANEPWDELLNFTDVIRATDP